MKYQHILAATDFSELGDVALARGTELAQVNGCRLTLVHILPEPEAPSPLFSHYVLSTDANRRQEACDKAAAALREKIPASVRDGDLAIEYEVRVGDPATEILTLDVQLKPDLIVVATHGRRGWQHWVMGSVAERIVQMAQADVLTVRTRPVTEPPTLP